MLEAIAFPIVIENIMRGRLGGYYFNTFLLAVEHHARVLWPALGVMPFLLLTGHQQAGMSQVHQVPQEQGGCTSSPCCALQQ